LRGKKTKDVGHKLFCTVKIGLRQLDALGGKGDMRCESTKREKGDIKQGME
jgi:hypothetical protein